MLPPLESARFLQDNGTVRITASRIVSHFILPPMLAQLRAAEPGIQIELVPSDESENLLYREAARLMADFARDVPAEYDGRKIIGEIGRAHV